MHFIRSIAVAAAILSVPSVVFFASAAAAPAEGASEIATPVGDVHALVTDETKQFKYLVKLMKDKKYWDGLLKELHVLDWEGTKALVTEVQLILAPKSGSRIEPGGDINDALANPFNAALKKVTDVKPAVTFATADSAKTGTDAFKPKEFVEDVSKTLVEYSKAIAITTKTIFATKPAVSDLADPLAKCFGKLKADKYTGDKKQLFDDLMKTVNENKDYEDSNLIWYILGGVLLLAIVAGIVIYVVLQRRNK